MQLFQANERGDEFTASAQEFLAFGLDEEVQQKEFFTLHAGGAEFLPGEEDGVVVILRVSRVLFLLQEGPTTHVLQTLRWVT